MNPTIHTAFWSDTDIEAVQPEIKLTVLWLITNPQTSIIGLCKVSGRRFAFETGLEAEWLEKACERLPRALLKSAEGIWIRNFIHHQFGRGDRLLKNNCLKPILSTLASIKDSKLLQALGESYPELSKLLDKGDATPLQAPSKGFVRGRVEKRRELNGKVTSDGGPGETDEPPGDVPADPAPQVPVEPPPPSPEADRELSAEEIASVISEIFNTTRRPGHESMFAISQAMPVLASEMAELRRFYAEPDDPNNPRLSRCIKPANLCRGLGDELVKARDFYASKRGRSRNGPAPPKGLPDRFGVWLAQSEYANAGWLTWDAVPEYARNEFSRWNRSHRQENGHA